jgi:hypothetical protein
MTDNERDKIIALGERRSALRSSLIGDAQQAKHDLHPKTLARRWVNRKREQVVTIAETGKQGLKKNAPVIGIASAAILLFAARKPIFDVIDRVRDKARKAKDQKL